jgi:hypothetical protein
LHYMNIVFAALGFRVYTVQMTGRADQYVVTTAAHLKARANPTRIRVVCEETDTQRPSRKIVTACRAFDVEATTLLDMLREEFPNEGF